jgi:predicted MFS family arabinose efflux permease
MGAGALASGGLVTLGRGAGSPVPPLVLPVLVAAVVSAASLVAVARLVREPHRSHGRLGAALAQAPAGVADGVRLLRRSPVLLALVLVEVTWGFGMVAFETLIGPRLGEVAGGTERAAVLLGPITSLAWLAAAAGAGLVPAVSRRLGVAATAALLRVAQGATVVGMGLLAGPVGVVAAFVACYAVHGASNPVHSALLHRQAGPDNRTVVLSINSMVAQPAFSVGSLLLGAVADRGSTGAAMLVAAGVLAAGAVLYLPARRQERVAGDGVRRGSEPRAGTPAA